MGNLDPQFRIGMRSELAHLYAENPRTCIYVTHDQAEAMTLGHRICVLREGRVLQIGTPDEIYNQPAHRFVAEFFGTPGTQCIDGRIDHSDGTTKFISGSMKIDLKEYKLPKGSITLGIRPENWDIVPAENATLSAVTKRVENLGDHRLLEVNTANHNIFIKTSLSDICINEETSFLPRLNRLIGSKDIPEKGSKAYEITQSDKAVRIWRKRIRIRTIKESSPERRQPSRLPQQYGNWNLLI